MPLRVSPTVRIRIRSNGPYVIETGEVEVVDAQGRVFTSERQPIALCRCGASTRKPFCDGTHARVGFDGRCGMTPPEGGGGSSRPGSDT